MSDQGTLGSLAGNVLASSVRELLPVNAGQGFGC
jgi:hypothetical protein